ncbi:MAG: GAF domain-containing SpoIIE family protein phosphatase, partial [Candidatus Baltobacteraceae bacterium]
RIAANIFNVPIALVTIVDEDRIWFKSRFGLEKVIEIPRDPGLCASAICNDELYIVEDARKDPRTLANPLVAADAGFQFYAAAPLRTTDGYNLGTLCIIDREPREMRRRDELESLATLGRIVSDALELRLAAIKTVQTEREVRKRITDTLQNSLLAQSMPLAPNFDIDAIYQPASTDATVGGDWYDAFMLNDDEMIVSIGDVEGHGLESAVIMGKLRLILRGLAHKESSPSALLQQLDVMMHREAPGAIATAIVARLHCTTGAMVWASAGHPYPLVRKVRGVVDVLENGGGVPLGVRSAEEPLERTVTLDPGDLVVFYTDGLIDARRQYVADEQRLIDRLARADMMHSKRPAHTLLNSIIPNGSQDDTAILVIRYRPNASPTTGLGAAHPAVPTS